MTPDVTADVTVEVCDVEPPSLGGSGSALWRGVYSSRLPALHRQLLLEACRIADRLDRLHDELEGRGHWFEAIYTDDGGEVTVVVDRGVAEARQNAMALKQLVEAIHKVAPKVRAPEQTSGGGGVVTDLLARIDRGA